MQGMKRRGINLKFLEDGDPGLEELFTSDLCHPEAEDDELFDPYEEDLEPALGDLVDEVQEALEDALKFLDEGLGAVRTDITGDEDAPPPDDNQLSLKLDR